MTTRINDNNPGKSKDLNPYDGFRLIYGTIDYKNLKSVYIDFITYYRYYDDVDIERYTKKMRRMMLDKIKNWNHPNFKSIGIVDINTRTVDLIDGQIYYMTGSITLFVEKPFIFRTDRLIQYDVEQLLHKMIDDLDMSLDFYETKC